MFDSMIDLRLLVSLCNLPQAGSSALLLVDGKCATVRLVEMGAPPGAVFGCTGLWVSDSVVYCAWIGREQDCYLSVIDSRTLTPLESGRLEGVRDVHSISVLDGWIYAVSTGTDEVRRVKAEDVGGHSEVVWRASEAGQDTHHVNAILPVNGRLLCSAFGPKSADRWSTALAGYVVDIGSGEILWQDIEHPHSLAVGPDGVYIAESRRACVRGLDSGRLFPVEGYARGLVFLPEGLAVAGVSRGRARSRSLGTIENPADAGEPGGETSLAFFFARAVESEQLLAAGTIDLSAHGPEIYDVAVLTPFKAGQESITRSPPHDDGPRWPLADTAHAPAGNGRTRASAAGARPSVP
jgi:hypothetical protein